MKPLARRLLSDHAEADDIVQQTCLAFLCRPPRSVEASRGWLRRVLRNLVLRSRQAKKRREKRERRTARPERISVTPDQILEQAEMHRLLTEEVLRMDEPYRSTVLLRFFGDQSLAQIARQQGVPLDTVKTRLRRAIEQLRGRLDHLYGGREAWTLGILSLVGGMAALSSPPAVASTTTAHAGLASTGGASSAATIADISLGGFVVSQKTVLTLGLIGIITLTGGYGLGRLASNPNAEDARTRLALAEARLKKDIAELKAEKEKLVAAKAGFEEEESHERARAEKSVQRAADRTTDTQATRGDRRSRSSRHVPL
jgi:RNA polymerase sigma-70 factor (ECF subfamily)